MYSPSSILHYNASIAILNCVHTERVLKLMDFEEGYFQDYTGQCDGVSVVVFSPSGSSLISTCGPTLHLWNIILE